MIQWHMGCSPYFATTGTHPLLPFDIAEENYLLLPPDSPLSTTNLIVQRAIALQKWREHLTELHRKVHTARLKAAIQFEKDHAHTICDYNFKSGDLVLIRSTVIKKALNWKMRARYRPLIVVSCNKGGAYIIAELDGTVFDRSGLLPLDLSHTLLTHRSWSLLLTNCLTFPDRISFRWNSQYRKTQKTKMMTTHLKRRFLQMTEDSQE